MSVKLSLATLANLPAEIIRPKYRRSDLKPGIVHIGVGNFHRAHQAVYLNDLFDAGADHDWALVGAGVRAADIDMRAKLEAQDWLTTVVEQEADATTVRVTGAMIDFIRPFDVEAMLSALARPEIRIVSLTVTEGGYYISPATQRFDPSHPDIAADAANPDAPKTAFGLIAAGLKRRRAAGVPPFTVMSCDNIPGNGHVTENAVAGLAELIDPELAQWIRANVAFPNSMVDRITPATTDRERGLLRDSYGVEDNWPVFCEEFRQWVVEDKFPSGRPALEKVGVTFTADVAPYELMKIRILNGGHAAIAYPAGLLDIHFVHEGMEDRQIATFLTTLTKARDPARRAAAAGGRSRSLSAEGRRTLRQPEDRRHDQPPLPRRLEPSAEVHPADGARPDRRRRERQGARARLGDVVPLLLWRIGKRQGHPAQRSELGPPPGGGEARAQRPARLSGDARHFRRARGRPDLCRRVLERPRVVVDERRARHARRLPR